MGADRGGRGARVGAPWRFAASVVGREGSEGVVVVWGIVGPLEAAVDSALECERTRRGAGRDASKSEWKRRGGAREGRKQAEEEVTEPRRMHRQLARGHTVDSLAHLSP